MKATHLLLVTTAVLFSTILRAPGQHRPGDTLWSLSLSADIATSPTVAPDGTLYLFAYPGLYAITNNGLVASNKWVFTNAIATGAPALATDGTIYLPASDGLYALDPGGAMKWRAPLPTPLSSPAVANDGTIYAFGSGRIYAFSASGSVRWQTAVDSTNGSGAEFSPVLGAEGTIYCGAGSSKVVTALKPTGALRWSAEVGWPTGESPAIGPDGSLYFSLGILGLLALSPSGAPLWTNGFGTDTFVGGIPVVGPDGTIYCSSLAGRGVTAVSASGQIKWRYQTSPNRAEPVPAPALDSVGNIYYCSDAAIICLAPDGTTNWVVHNESAPNGSMVSPTIGPDGTVYAAVWNTLYAYYNTNKPADAPWPMYRQNYRHTGKVEKPALAQPRRRADGSVELEMYGQLGQSFEVQQTSDFVTWSSLTNFTATDLPTELVDGTATAAPIRFYRAVQH